MEIEDLTQELEVLREENVNLRIDTEVLKGSQVELLKRLVALEKLCLRLLYVLFFHVLCSIPIALSQHGFIINTASLELADLLTITFYLCYFRFYQVITTCP